MDDLMDVRIDSQATLRAQVPDPIRMQVPVTMRALQQRMNRRLAKEDKVLKKARGCREMQHLGTYYLLDVFNNTVTHCQVDPVLLAQDLGVLAAWETVREEEEG